MKNIELKWFRKTKIRLFFKMSFVVCLMLLFTGVGVTSAEIISGWETEKIVEGLIEKEACSPSIGFNVTGDGKWTLIAGYYAGAFNGFYWNGTQWIEDSSRVAGLGDIGSCSTVTVAFNVTGDGNWCLIAKNSDGNFYGYYWDGIQWIEDSSRVNGLPAISGASSLTIIDNLTGNGTWTLISGNDEGTFKGFYWNGTQWIEDSSRVAGLEDVGSRSTVTAAFNVTGDGNRDLISGNRGGTFNGFYWNGDQWVEDSSRVAGLGDVGTDSAPEMAFNVTGDESWNLISGSWYKGYHGFMYNTVDTETLSPITDVSHAHILATTANINWTYDRTWNHRVEYSTNSDLSEPRWSDWQIDTNAIDIKLWNLQPNTVYYYKAYTYVPWNHSYYVNSSIQSFTTLACSNYKIVNPGESIQDALDMICLEGGTVELAAGVHDVYDTIVIHRGNITIQGTHESEIKIHDSDKHVFYIDPDQHLENFLFKGFKVTSDFEAWRGSNTVIRASNITNITVEDILALSHASDFVRVSIKDWGSPSGTRKNIFIKNNTVRYNIIFIAYSENVHVFNNTVMDAHWSYGLDMNRDNNYVYVHDNYVKGGGNGCIKVYCSWYQYIYDNIFEGSKEGIGIIGHPTHTIVENNIIKGNMLAGILIMPQEAIIDLTIRNNRIYDNSASGILIRHFESGTPGLQREANITNNVIYNNSGDGIRMESDWVELNIRNNIIINNTGYGITNMETHPNTTLGYNNVWNNANNNYRGISAGTGDISIDPLFVDPANRDFHLKSQYGRWDGSNWVNDDVTSLCIDAGDASSDYTNEPQPNGGRINMGAYGNTIYASKSKSSGGRKMTESEIIYPNPYIKGKSLSEKIIFDNLPKEAMIRIYTVSGDLVKTIKHKDTADGGSEEWDISGITSGVYMYTIISSEGKKTGKVSIIK